MSQSTRDRLHAFLTARFDEDAAIASAAVGRRYLYESPQTQAHIRGPGSTSRVLLDVAIRRALLDEHGETNGSCSSCGDAQWGYPVMGGMSPVDAPCETLRLLALSYKSHADYDPEWAPKHDPTTPTPDPAPVKLTFTLDTPTAVWPPAEQYRVVHPNDLEAERALLARSRAAGEWAGVALAVSEDVPPRTVVLVRASAATA